MRGSRDTLMALLIGAFVAVGLILLSGQFVRDVSAEDIEKALKLPVTSQPTNLQAGTQQDPIALTDAEDLLGRAVSTRQPSEIACMISKSIFDDYTTRGDGGNRDNGKGNCEKSKCLVDVKRFELESGVLDPGGWEGKLLVDPTYGPGCHFCEDHGTAVPNLDEICINLNLKDRRIGTSGPIICSQPFGDPQGGGTLTFGNYHCAKLNGVGIHAAWYSQCDGWWCYGSGRCTAEDGAWALLCGYPGKACEDANDGVDDFCDHDREKIIWVGENKATAENFEICANIFCPNDANKISDGTSINENEYALDIGYQYIYGIVWDPVNHRYELRFARVPKEKTAVAADISSIGATFFRFLRYNMIGNWYKQAREVEYLTVTGVTKNVGDIITDIEAANPVAKVTFGDLCNNENDCRTTKPKNLDNSICRDDAYIPITQFRESNVVLRTGGGLTQNGALDPGKCYKISIKNWFNLYGTAVSVWNSLYGGRCFDRIDRSISIFQYNPPC